ncbi:MAG: acyl-CoA dehydrogenase family protein [Oscillospiraceae bacterium]
MHGRDKRGPHALLLRLLEPQAGSDSHAILTSYVRREDRKIEINGHKTFISMAGLCPYMACLARDFTREGELFHHVLRAHGRPRRQDRPLHKIGWNADPTYEVYLENVVVEEKDIIGKEGEAFKQLMRNFEMERLMMAVAILGMAECAYEDAAKYANQRVQFGKPIGTRQLIQEKIVNMKIKIMNMKNLCYQCAWEKDQGISIRNASALCKLYCAQAGNEVIDDALQIMGGIGYTQDCRISRLWRDARNYRIGGGTDEIMIHIAGRGLLKK